MSLKYVLDPGIFGKLFMFFFPSSCLFSCLSVSKKDWCINRGFFSAKVEPFRASLLQQFCSQRRNQRNNLLRKKTKSAESPFFNPILLFTERERALLLHKFAFCKNVEIQIQVNFNFAGYKKKKNVALKLETNSNKNHNVV